MDDFIEETEVKGVYIISRPTFEDERGFFRETYRKVDLEKRIGYSFDPVQSNHSRSIKNTLRGIHIAPWDKLVTVTRGRVQQVVVDCRKDSETFGKSISIIMGEENRVSVFIPKNCGNAFAVLSDDADYFYLTTAYWEKGLEKNIIYNDSYLNIKWETNEPVLSPKDLTNPGFKEVFNY